MYLAIDAQTGIAYVGVDGPNRALPPGSSLTQATLIKDETSWANVPSSPQFEMSPWLFLEHSFDPVTRIRRGSLYQVESTSGRTPRFGGSVPMNPRRNPGEAISCSAVSIAWNLASSAVGAGNFLKHAARTFGLVVSSS